MKRRFFNRWSSTTAVVPPPPPPPSPPPPPGVVYDTSIGMGVTNGRANLPLRSGAKRFFVNTVGGSNGTIAAAQSPSTPMATAIGAALFVTDGAADHIMIAEGSTVVSLAGFNGRGGYSPAYPAVIETYDPLDPYNESKYGNPTVRPLVNQAGGYVVVGSGGGAAPNYVALRGFVFDAGNVDGGTSIGGVPTGVGGSSYVLIENNVLRYGIISFDMLTSATGIVSNYIIRGNSMWGAWWSGGHISPYFDNIAGLTFEDNFLWHNGWDVTKTRETDYTLGGLHSATNEAVFRHPFYIQDSCSGIVRRNLVVDAPTDCGSVRGSFPIYENLAIDCPLGFGAGGGSNYPVPRPNGVDLEVHHNAILGDADIDTLIPDYGGSGFGTLNGTPGSSCHHNLFARSRNPNGPGTKLFSTDALYPQPSYMYYHDNVEYLWTVAGRCKTPGTGTYAAYIHDTYANNYWSEADGVSGGQNISHLTMPSPYTLSQLLTLYSYANKQAMIDDFKEHPEKGATWQAMRQSLFIGYGVPA